jgi:class 3 adenylate cyclase
MELRNLHRRARPFRYLAFWSMAVVCVLLLGTDRAPALILAVTAACLAWPPWADFWDRRARAVPAGDARRVARTHLFECVLCGALFGCLSVPPLAALAATLALLAGVTAQAGWSLLAAAVPALGIGIGAGLLAAPTLTVASTGPADAVAAVFALGFAVALAQVSFRQAQRLYARERTAAGRVRRLESMAGRMEPYLAPSLRARILATGERDPASGRRDRRWLTVAFVDLVGFTELATRVEAETLAPLLDDYLAGVCELALRQGGEVTKVLGDGVLVAFGLDGPLDRRAAAAGAVRFCQGLSPLLDALARDWRARGEPVELQVRVGIASGHCTVGDWGGSGYRDFTMIGSPVNLASRLQAGAPAGTALLDPPTAALVEDRVSLGPPAELQVRGFGAVAVRALAPLGAPCG